MRASAAVAVITLAALADAKLHLHTERAYAVGIHVVDQPDSLTSAQLQTLLEGNQVVHLRNAAHLMLARPQAYAYDELLKDSKRGAWPGLAGGPHKQRLGAEPTLACALKADEKLSLGVAIPSVLPVEAVPLIGEGRARSISTAGVEALQDVKWSGALKLMEHVRPTKYMVYAQTWGGITPHKHDAVFNVQVSGSKHWAFWWGHPFVSGAAPTWAGESNFTSFFSEDLPKLKHLKPVSELDANPGDIIHIPQNVYHATHSSSSRSVGSIFFFDVTQLGVTPRDARAMAAGHEEA